VLQEAGSRWDDAHVRGDRLTDDHRDLIPRLGEHGVDRLDVVPTPWSS
jgi:hypothetical protein